MLDILSNATKKSCGNISNCGTFENSIIYSHVEPGLLVVCKLLDNLIERLAFRGIGVLGTVDMAAVLPVLSL